jgi:hypothetical protein
MSKILGFTLGFILSYGVVGYAQNVSVSLAATYQLCWDQDAADLPTAQSYTYQVAMDGGAANTVIATCSGTATPFKCIIPPPLPAVTNGKHTFLITASVLLIDGSTLSTVSTTFGQYIIVGKPSVPINLRVNKSGT